MSHFPALTYSQAVRKLKKCGFVFYRQARGSHELWVSDSDKRVVTVSRHSSRIIKRKTLSNIIKATGLSIDEFNSL